MDRPSATRLSCAVDRVSRRDPVVRELTRGGLLARIKQTGGRDLGLPEAALAACGAQAHSSFHGRHRVAEQFSTVHSRQAASLSAADTEGIKRLISIALTAARETPARRASSACVQPRWPRNSFRRVVPAAGSDIILSLY